MTDAQALFERGHAALEAEDFPEAIECLSRAIAADPRVAAGPMALAASDMIVLLLYFNLGRILLT